VSSIALVSTGSLFWQGDQKKHATAAAGDDGFSRPWWWKFLA
jgi:hypothetical protein